MISLYIDDQSIAIAIYVEMNGCKHLAGRIRQRSSSIPLSLLPNCDIGSSVRRSSSCAATTALLTNDQSIAKRRRGSITQSIPPHNNINRYNNNIKQHLRLQYFSTSAVDDDTEVDDIGEELKLISINDHLDELQHIPLEDVRNFCIIAHVVRFILFVYCLWHSFAGCV